MKQLDLFGKNDEEKIENPFRGTFEDNPYLGPKSPFIGHSKYIKSEVWKEKKRFAIQKANYQCQGCGKKGPLEVHHLHYNSLYHEKLKDVEVLCHQCHVPADNQRATEAAYATYAEKIYGDDWWKYDNE